MTTVGVTGHLNLTEETAGLVKEEIKRRLAQFDKDALVGVSCIAKGADSLFADAVLELGGKLVVIVPSQDYRDKQASVGHSEDFDRLLQTADEVVLVERDTADQSAYREANREMLARVEQLIAIWDGSAVADKDGGTGGAVLDAINADVPVRVVWPDGAQRG